jgi:DHA1 family tetracycline resistance protein-like MFS transporter
MLPLFFIVFIDLLGFGIIIPLLPFYGETYGASPAMVGLLMATYSLGQFVMAPIWGRLSDRIGRRPVLLITLGGAAAAYIWLGVAHSLWALFAARAVGGVMAGNIGTAFAYVADITTRETRAKGMGMIGAAFGLGFIAGPAIGGLLAGPNPADLDVQTPALAAAGLSFLAFVLAYLILKESLSDEIRQNIASQPARSRQAEFTKSLKHPQMGALFAVSFLSTFVFAGMEATFALFSERAYGWGAQQNGYLFAFVGLVSAAIQGGLIGPLARRFGEPRLIVQGSLALAVGIFLIPFAGSLWVLLVSMIIVAYGFSVTSPVLNSLISQQIDDDEQGAVLGVARSVTTLARVAGPIWAGFLFSMMGRAWPYYAGSVVMIVVTVLGLHVARCLTAEKNADEAPADSP